MAGLQNMTHLRFDKRILVLGVLVSMIIPIQAASALNTGIYGIHFEEASIFEIDANDGTIIGGDPIALGPIVLPSDPASTTDYGGTAMSTHSDGRFFASLFDSAIGDPTEPTLSVIEESLPATVPPTFIVTPSLTFINDTSKNILPIDGLAFDSSDTLYGATIDEDLVGALYTLPLDGSAATFICNLPTPSDTAEAIAFNSTNALFRIFGDPAVLQTVDFSTNPCTVTNISLSQSISDYFLSLTFTGNGFLGTTSNGDLFSISESGDVTDKNTPANALPEIGGLTKFGLNQPPVADDQSVSVEEDEPKTIILTGSDPDGDVLTFTITSGPSNGSLDTNTPATNANGVSADVLYTPNLNYFGPDSFTFTVNDGTVGSIVDGIVTITVNQVDDDPIAVDDTYETNADTVLTVDAPGVLGNDIDPDPNPQLKVDSNTSPSAEGVTVNVNPDGSFTYDPTTSTSLSALAAGDALDDTFDYTMSDNNNIQSTATVTITVTGVNVGIFVEPEFQEDLTDKMIKQFKKKIYNWENRIDKLEYKIIKLEAKAAKAEANGNQERANWLYAKAADKQDKTEILEDFISIAKISIGAIPAEPVPVEFQDNLLPKSVDKIEHKIIKWMHKIAKLNHQAEKLEEKAEYYLEKGKVEKAEKLLDKAAAKRAKAQVFEDLNEVLIVAIAYDPSDVKLHDKHDDKHDKHDDKHDKHDDKYDKEGHS